MAIYQSWALCGFLVLGRTLKLAGRGGQPCLWDSCCQVLLPLGLTTLSLHYRSVLRLLCLCSRLCYPPGQVGWGLAQNKQTISKQCVHPELFTMSICQLLSTLEAWMCPCKMVISITFKLGLVADIYHGGCVWQRISVPRTGWKHKERRLSMPPSRTWFSDTTSFHQALPPSFQVILWHCHICIWYFLATFIITPFLILLLLPLLPLSCHFVLFCDPLNWTKTTHMGMGVELSFECDWLTSGYITEDN